MNSNIQPYYDYTVSVFGRVMNHLGLGGVRRVKAVKPITYSTRDGYVTLGFALIGFISLSGLHRLYVGKTWTGILYLLTLGWFGVGTAIDVVMILSGKFKDKNGNVVYLDMGF